ncbi:uncharacterized protein L969DRAFT_84222 [Mixia osmundae IAM 14324]|uniref:mRNA export factor GLE1 n=1 Tax=Mixia osmundae (strain CBS 9802 / IAM 14324 / JCM 22182 / KY 12970) TaxID=764103 RepID=G7E876_MIXOS|nr:uncharacterized protein L969DRAFT_84222 [Mixia osmundae IAM 14324]KEI42372.1 hypothetical protein L969DRAFT_84222 [Mixia osmundae IAM 14324]GAA99036.1 hypothetical protein E5Q_05725 [Mixia osmundae IAM 14324]
MKFGVPQGHADDDDDGHEYSDDSESDSDAPAVMDTPLKSISHSRFTAPTRPAPPSASSTDSKSHRSQNVARSSTLSDSRSEAHCLSSYAHDAHRDNASSAHRQDAQQTGPTLVLPPSLSLANRLRSQSFGPSASRIPGTMFRVVELSDSSDEDEAGDSDGFLSSKDSYAPSQLDEISRHAALRDAGQSDPWDQWNADAQRQSWLQARQTQHQRQGQRTLADLAGRQARREHDKASTRREIDAITTALEQTEIARRQDEDRTVKAFEARNSILWRGIDEAIRIAEHKASVAREEAAREQKEQQEAAAKQAQAKAEAEAKAGREKEAAQAATKAAEERQKLAAEQKAKDDAAKAAAQTTTQAGVGGWLSPLEEWQRHRDLMVHIKTQILPLVKANPTWKATCFAEKRQITKRIGQVTNSARDIIQITQDLGATLQRAQATPACYDWLCNHLSKSLIAQAETEITSRREVAFPLARIVLGLILAGHDRFGSVLMARLVKKCFWITAAFPPKASAMTEEEHQKLLGYRPASAGESSIQYASRQAGILTLWAAIVQTSPMEQPPGPARSTEQLALVPKELRPAAAWRWLVLVLKTPLVGLEPIPQMLHVVLEVAGKTLSEAYGRVFINFLGSLVQDGIKANRAGFNEKSKATVTTLQLLLEDWQMAGRIQSLKDRDL